MAGAVALAGNLGVATEAPRGFADGPAALALLEVEQGDEIGAGAVLALHLSFEFPPVGGGTSNVIGRAGT